MGCRGYAVESGVALAGFVADFRHSWRTARTSDPGIAGGAPITGGQHGGRRCPARVPIVGPSSGAAHSARSATSGSTLVARRAGIQHATTVTETSTTAIAMKVIGSVALTP